MKLHYFKIMLSVSMLMAVTSLGAPTMPYEESFTAINGWSDVSDPALVNIGVAGGALSITFANPEGGSPGSSIIFANAGDSGGNFIDAGGSSYAYNDLSVYFSVRAVTESPGYLQFYFQGSSTREWIANVGAMPAADNEFHRYSLGVNSFAAWEPFMGAWSGANWLEDIGSVTRIGLRIVQGSNNQQEIYEFGEFGTNVPEPETVWMILAVALSLGMTFRGDRKSVV